MVDTVLFSQIQSKLPISQKIALLFEVLHQAMEDNVCCKVPKQHLIMNNNNIGLILHHRECCGIG